MNSKETLIKSETYVSPKAVFIALPLFCVALHFAASMWAESGSLKAYTLLALSTSIVTCVGWMVTSRNVVTGRWLALAGVLATVHATDFWLRVPFAQILTLLPIPLAAALCGPVISMLIAAGETFLTLMLLLQATTDSMRMQLSTMLIAILALAAVVQGLSGSTHHVAQWAWHYYQQAQKGLEEARRRKAELEQALDDLVHAHRQIALDNERIANLRLVAEEARRSKEAFVARVSHEFRTPLNIIIGLISLMVESPEVYGEQVPPKIMEHLHTVYRNCKHLAGLIEDVLALSQMEAGRIYLHREYVDVLELVHTSLQVVQPLMEEKGLYWRVECSEQVPRVYCDRVRIRQVILNLLSNAARFTERGGIVVRVTCADGRVTVSVKDTGPGISKEDAQRIFEPFYQADEVSRSGKGGSGLGLSISKKFVELHGGRMWLESTPGAGSTFFVELPVTEAPPHLAKPGAWIREEWPWIERRSRPALPGGHFRPHVIVCDETGDLCNALARCTDEIEFTQTSVLDDALYLLENFPASALLINTLTMESLWSALERAWQAQPELPIVGCLYPPRMEYALALGAKGYLTKPLTGSDLSEALTQLGKPIRRILIVDDDSDTCELLSLFIRVYDASIEVEIAESGRQAINEMRTRPPDVVLLDVVMPDLDGWEVLKEMNEDIELQQIPVIIVSAQDPRSKPWVSQALVLATGRGFSIDKTLGCFTTLYATLRRTV